MIAPKDGEGVNSLGRVAWRRHVLSNEDHIEYLPACLSALAEMRKRVEKH